MRRRQSWRKARRRFWARRRCEGTSMLARYHEKAGEGWNPSREADCGRDLACEAGAVATLAAEDLRQAPWVPPPSQGTPGGVVERCCKLLRGSRLGLGFRLPVAAEVDREGLRPLPSVVAPRAGGQEVVGGVVAAVAVVVVDRGRQAVASALSSRSSKATATPDASATAALEDGALANDAQCPGGATAVTQRLPSLLDLLELGRLWCLGVWSRRHGVYQDIAQGPQYGRHRRPQGRAYATLHPQPHFGVV